MPGLTEAGENDWPPAEPSAGGGTDHAGGIDMEKSLDPPNVTSDTGLGVDGVPPSKVAPSVPVGGVNSATSIRADPASGERQFEQCSAPGRLLVLQWGQSIAGSNHHAGEPHKLRVSSSEIK